ncbi:MAG: hypothetical protein ACRDBO_03500 [Lachnospiraceae bacterium]
MSGIPRNLNTASVAIQQLDRALSGLSEEFNTASVAIQPILPQRQRTI